ncbi:MAG: cobalamin-independent methionine synthase II family protein [Alphaproteobacteria bacterium]|nr:cobalamin-independent methionine synthase II family protein [Alphaproteobacteria bacterium]
MKTSTERILTTHVGSLPRPDDLIALLIAKDREEAFDEATLAARVPEAVAEVVEQQITCGVDIVSDGELGKISYVNYVKHRIEGFGAPAPLDWTPQDLADHPAPRPPAGPAVSPPAEPNPDPPACRGPLSVRDRAPLEADLAAFRSAVDKAKPTGAFMNAASPGVVAHFMPNKYYPSHEAYVDALADVLRDEYEAIFEAGFLLQIDCPDLAMARHMGHADLSLKDFRKSIAHNIEALNRATDNIPTEAMRLHVCWGNYPGPHTHDVPLKEIADIVFAGRPQAILFEAANPAHAHQWEEMAEVEIPEDKILVPGVIDTNTNHVEHPKLIAQRIARYADLVGRERVMAGTDCGFSTLASLPRVWPSVVWEKLRAMAEGAAIASDRLWGKR